MARADVVVVGQGLAGMTAALAAAQTGATVQVLAKGHAALYWGTGNLEVATVEGTATPREGLERLAGIDGHPYQMLAAEVEPALEWLRGVLADQGLVYEGGLDTPLARVPTSIGGTRLAAILPAAQAAAARPWGTDETLVVCGVDGFKDCWPDAIAASLGRERVWRGADTRPARVVAASAQLPDMADRHNLNGVTLARHFDDPKWRAVAFDRIASTVRAAALTAGVPGDGIRVALPAVVGLADHATAWDELRRLLPGEPFEMPLVPPSLPGMRLYAALRRALLAAGGRILMGEEISRVEALGGRVVSVAMKAAVRDFRIRTDNLILATGGIAGGGIVAEDSDLREVVLGLPVEAPAADGWFAAGPFDPEGHPLETAGIRTNEALRPLAPASAHVPGNVRVVGALLAGQHALREGSRAGVSFTSGRRAGSAAIAGRAPAPRRSSAASAEFAGSRTGSAGSARSAGSVASADSVASAGSDGPAPVVSTAGSTTANRSRP